MDGRDLISYRTLTRADFKGELPPRHMQQYVDRLGAFTCALIIPAADSGVEASHSADGSYIARARNLRFIAKMDRNCSWWNEALALQAPEYVLEHEQIHFSLFELAARRLNANGERLKAGLTARARSAQAAMDEVNAEMTTILQRVLEDALAENTRFDQDTSLSFNAVKQREWQERVRRELARTQPSGSD